MDEYGFFVELKNYLGFAFDGDNKIAGSLNGLNYEICFASYGTLRVHSVMRLFGDDPFKDHIESAFQKLVFFKSYSIVNDNVFLFVDSFELTEDAAFAITEDLTSFSASLSALGYKSVTEGTGAFAAPAAGTTAYYEQIMEKQGIKRAEPQPALPDNMFLGIIGALLGTAGSVLIWFLLSMLNYTTPYIIGAVLVVTAPIVMYELFSKERTSAFQMVLCLFLSLLGIFVGERFIWTFTLLYWYDDITFEIAYYEVPHLIEDYIVEAFDYYKDYVICFAALAIMYFVIIRNYLKGGMTIREMLSARRKR
jgi:uncharacterized membrane protein YeaQ/YmgE (transglycosylase-associated protein family)